MKSAGGCSPVGPGMMAQKALEPDGSRGPAFPPE